MFNFLCIFFNNIFLNLKNTYKSYKQDFFVPKNVHYYSLLKLLLINFAVSSTDCVSNQLICSKQQNTTAY